MPTPGIAPYKSSRLVGRMLGKRYDREAWRIPMSGVPKYRSRTGYRRQAYTQYRPALRNYMNNRQNARIVRLAQLWKQRRR